MKKILIILLLVFLIINTGFTNSKEEIRGVFISYIEEKEYLSKDEEKSKINIKEIINNIKKSNYNLIILQVRSNCDSIYNSNIFKEKLEGLSNDYFDVLDYFIQESHKKGIKVYAWINPYRIRTTIDTSTITELSPAYKYLNTDYIYINNGIYFNPSKKEVEDLIVEGVKEIIDNYKVDGILFDDYFYPGDDVDIKDYNEYIENNNYVDPKTYHLNIINRMVKRVHTICKNKNVLFGISPDGNINNNYDYLYADIYKWLDSSDYVDYIMPQIYYGFFNESKPFYNIVHEWNNYIKNKDIKLIIALAMYKSGNYDKYAKSGEYEWINSKDILKKEVLISRNLKQYNGFSIFRYDNLYGNNINDNQKEEASNLHQILN
ncbi:MAG: family 10 glycosylhydrolase [Bacilli bacterium]|nr:family 10 glycosylhydrolase [Bacilli bacterium]